MEIDPYAKIQDPVIKSALTTLSDIRFFTCGNVVLSKEGLTAFADHYRMKDVFNAGMTVLENLASNTIPDTDALSVKNVVEHTIVGMISTGDVSAMPVLKRLAHDKRKWVRQAILSALPYSLHRPIDLLKETIDSAASRLPLDVSDPKAAQDSFDEFELALKRFCENTDPASRAFVRKAIRVFFERYDLRAWYFYKPRFARLLTSDYPMSVDTKNTNRLWLWLMPITWWEWTVECIIFLLFAWLSFRLGRRVLKRFSIAK